MKESNFRKQLADLPIKNIRYFESIGSTNDDALAWATAGAPDFSLIYAEEQTSGRGRTGRTWLTPPATALALSLILRPTAKERQNIGLFSGLAALALVSALKTYGIAAQIKWPNDVLINRKKTAGILVETVWMGAEAESVVLGMGVNVTPESVPPFEMLTFPATCIAAEMATPIERMALLHTLLAELIAWRPKLATDEFIRAWDQALAFRGETVQVWSGTAEPMIGQVQGIETDGSLRLHLSEEETRVIHFGEVHLRPL